MMVHAWNSSCGEKGAGGPGVQSYYSLQGKYEASLDYSRLFQNKQTKIDKTWKKQI